MNMSRYTVNVDGQKVDVEAWGIMGAAAKGMKHFNLTSAEVVKCVSSENERKTYYDAKLNKNDYVSSSRVN